MVKELCELTKLMEKDFAIAKPFLDLYKLQSETWTDLMSEWKRY